MKLSENRIINLKKFIYTHGTVTVEQISEAFHVSDVTARRDLARLKKEGYIQKVHGGAVLRELGQLETEPVFKDRLGDHKEEKIRIAREAAKRIKNNSIVIIESGSTCFYMIDFLIDKKSLRIATCGIPLANELIRLARIKKDFEINISGGLVRHDSQVYTGPHTLNFFYGMNANMCFISALGISVKKGISTDNYYDADISRKIISTSNKVILLCDSAKFNKYSYVHIASLDKIDEIITDDKISKDNLNELTSRSIHVTVV